MGTMEAGRKALVVSAHSADFVWRAGGAIALHAARGFEITIVCLSFGERGESQKLWAQKGMTMERVKAARKEEATRAAEILGVKDIRFFDLGDYPLRVPDESLYRLVSIYRSVRPEFVLTHAHKDPYNFDHPLASHVVQEARVVAQAQGHDPGTTPIGAPPVFLFEPHQTEQCEWKPDVFLDITEVWEKNARLSKPWERKNICGSTTPVSRYSAECRQRGIPTRRSNMVRRTNASFRRLRSHLHE